MSVLRSRIPGPGGSQKVAPTAHAGPVKSHSIGDQHRSKATEWANQQLRSSGFEGDIDDLVRDITDGVNFPNLVQCLTSAKVPGIGLPPRNEFERRKNIQESFTFLESQGINLEGVPCKDVIDRKPNAVMDLMRHLMHMGINGKGINNSVKGLVTNGNMNDELSGKRPSGLRRPTTPTATFSSSVQPRSAATSGLNRPSNLPSLTSPASSGPSSPASMSPNMARSTPSTSPKTGTAGTSASSAGHLHPGQNSQNSSSPGNSPGLKKSPGGTPSRLAMQTKKASDVNSPTMEKQEFPQGIPRASGLKGPTTRFRQSSPPTVSQSASGKNTSVNGNNDQGRPKGILRSPSVPRRSSDILPPDPGSKRENWNRNDRSVSEAPSSKLINMRGAKLGILPQGMKSPHNSQLQQPNLKGVSSLGGVGGSSVASGYNRATPSGIASPTSRHRNYSEGSNMKHNVLVKRSSELQMPKIATERQQQQQQQQQLAMKTQDDDVKTKGKLSGLSKNLFGAFGHKGVSKKKSNDLNEGKTLNSPQKAESRTIGEQQVENEPSSKATSKAEIPKDTSQTTLTTSLSSSSSTTTTTTTTTTDEPVKALLYTTALDDTPSDGDDDGTHSVATGCTIKGGPCSPSSIGDLSTLDSLPPSATSTLELDGNRTKPDKVKEGENLSEKSEKVLQTEGDKSLPECPESPKSLDVLGGERLSPDGGLGSPKSTKDDSDTLPTDTKTTTTTTDTKTITTDTKTTTDNKTTTTDTKTTTTIKDKVPESPVSPKIPTDPVMTKGMLSSSHALALPVTTRSTHPHVRPQVPKTSSRVTMEARYHIGGLNKPSPLTCSDKKPHSEPVSPSGMGMKLGTNSSQEVLHSNSVKLRRRDNNQRRHSPSSEGTALNPSVVSLKAMHRMSRSMGEAIDQLSNMDINDPSLIIFNSAPTSARATPLNTPSELNKVLQNDSDSDSDEFSFTGDLRRELSSSPASSSLSTETSLSHKEPRGRSFTTIGSDHVTSNPAHSPTVLPHPPRKFSIEDKGIIDATGTLPRGAKIRRSFNVKQKWKDDMQTGNGSEDTGRSDHGLEEEIHHWKKVAESLQQQLSTTKFDLDKKGKILNMYESDYATLTAKLQHMEVALEEKTKVAELVHKNSSTSLDTVSLCEGEDDIFKEKGKKKKKGWKGFGLKLGKKGNQESDPLQRKPEVLVSMESADSSGELNKKKWSSKENLLAEITNLREQLTHLQQQNIELKRRSLSPREGLVRSQSPNRTPSRPRSYEIDHPLLEFVDMEEGVPVPIVLHDEFRTGKDQKCNTFIGCVNVHDKTTWDDMDCKILAIFKHHVWSIDPEEGMGLVDNSICTYSFMGNWRDIGEPKPPPEDPLSLTSKPNPHVVVYLKGVRQRSSDLLAYQLLLNVSIVDSYVDMILKNRWLVLMGAKGSFKTKMATHMVRFLSNKLFGVPNKYVTFSMDTDGTQISSVLEWFQSNVENPQTHIVLVDGVFECNGVEQILNAASLMETKPYLLITIAQAHSRGSSLHSLMFRFPVRMISCTPQSEPVSHMLPRQLRKQFLELKAHRRDNIDSTVTQLIHWLPRLLDYLNSVIVKFHSATVALGPAIFLPCPLHLAPYDLEHWFISQWNHFIAPYVRGSVMAGVESHGLPFGAEWKDPRDWILDTYPWTDSKNKDKLQNISDEDVGLNHAIRISPQASISASTYASSVIDQDIQSMVDVQSNLS